MKTISLITCTLVICISLIIAPFVSHAAQLVIGDTIEGAGDNKVNGNVQVNGIENGIIFSDGSKQTTATLQGPPGPEGPQGPDGPQGPAGADGFHCWDLNHNGQCDLATEDITTDGSCDTSDCQGPPGPQGPQGDSGVCDTTTLNNMIGSICDVAYEAGISTEEIRGLCGWSTLVFASSMTYVGNLGGLSGADATCQALADAAGLPGTYKAWLSDSTTSASSRITHSARPYRLVDGTLVANDWFDLTDGSLIHPIDRDEYGNMATVYNSIAWTNTLPSGLIWYFSTSTTCLDWYSYEPPYSGGTGSLLSSIDEWTYQPSTYWICPLGAHLYCFML